MIEIEMTFFVKNGEEKHAALIFTLFPKTPFTFIIFPGPIDFTHVNTQMRHAVEFKIIERVLIRALFELTVEQYSSIVNLLNIYGVIVNGTLLPPSLLRQHINWNIA